MRRGLLLLVVVLAACSSGDDDRGFLAELEPGGYATSTTTPAGTPVGPVPLENVDGVDPVEPQVPTQQRTTVAPLGGSPSQPPSQPVDTTPAPPPAVTSTTHPSRAGRGEPCSVPGQTRQDYTTSARWICTDVPGCHTKGPGLLWRDKPCVDTEGTTRPTSTPPPPPPPTGPNL